MPVGFAKGKKTKTLYKDQGQRSVIRQGRPLHGLHQSHQQRHSRPAAVPNTWVQPYFAGKAGKEHGYPQDKQLIILVEQHC